MEFCITFIDLEMPPGMRRRHHIYNALGGKVLLFQTQRKAMKWIVKHGVDQCDYTVDPWHDLEGCHAS